jgi:protein O-mannosyl-transferase
MFGSRIRAHDRTTPRLTAQLFLLLFLLVCVVFHPVLRGEILLWDDNVSISDNPHLNSLGWEQLKWIFTDTSYMWRYQPLCWLTWTLIKQSCGLRPVAFHLVVLLFHAANTGLVFLLVRKLLLLAARTKEDEAPMQLSICAALAAALWAVNPLRVETTAWAVELVFVQPLFFLLLSVLCYLASAETGTGRAIRFYWTSLVLYLASLISFPIALGGFVVFIALDIYPLRRLSLDPRQWLTPEARRLWLEKIPFAAVAIFLGWLNLRVRAHPGVSWSHLKTLDEFGATGRVMQAFYIWAYYVWKPWWPFHLTPVPTQLIDFQPFDAPFVLSAILVIGLSALLFRQRFRWPGIFAVWLCHLGLLVPMLGLSEHPHYPADRYSIAVGICWPVLLGGLLAKLWPRPQARRSLLAALAVVIPALGWMSYQQTFLWQTNVGFFHQLLADWKDSPVLLPRRVDFYMRLATAHSRRGELPDAIEALRTAVQLAPDYAAARRQLGDAELAAGQLDAASSTYAAAARLDPNSPPPLNDLGVAYARQGKLDRATETFAEALRLEPANRSALQNMAMALQKLGRTNEAVAYRTRLREAPAGPTPH